jgi:hypothetical protein
MPNWWNRSSAPSGTDCGMVELSFCDWNSFVDFPILFQFSINIPVAQMVENFIHTGVSAVLFMSDQIKSRDWLAANFCRTIGRRVIALRGLHKTYDISSVLPWRHHSSYSPFRGVHSMHECVICTKLRRKQQPLGVLESVYADRLEISNSRVAATACFRMVS